MNDARHPMSPFRFAPHTLIALIGCALAAASAQTPQIVEYTLPNAASSPYGIAAGSDGNIWFTETANGKIGRITPQGAIDEFSAFDYVNGGIAAAPDGTLRFSTNTAPAK